MSLLEPRPTDLKKLPYDSLTLVISYSEPVVTITRKMTKGRREWSQDLVYYTDRRGEKNPRIVDKRTIESKTEWNGNILMSKSRYEFYDGAFYFYEATDSWELSPDGKTLTQTTLIAEEAKNTYGRTISMGSYEQRHAKRVFNKSE